MHFDKTVATVEGICTERERYFGLFDYSNKRNTTLGTTGDSWRGFVPADSTPPGLEGHMCLLISMIRCCKANLVDDHSQFLISFNSLLFKPLPFSASLFDSLVPSGPRAHTTWQINNIAP